MTSATTSDRAAKAVPSPAGTRPAKPCGCCWRTDAEDGSPIVLGALAMPGRRTFLVCADCVNYMWRGRHPMGEATRDAD